MAESTRERDVDVGAVVYRPVSGLAIAGLGLAVLYALIVTGIGLVAVLTGAPFLFPGLLVVAVAAGVLSGAALVRIARSEGTRAGRKLALWGLMLSLLAGLGYGAYVIATEMAVRLQAETFTDSWIALLRDGDVDTEYLLTQFRLSEVQGKVKTVAAEGRELVVTDLDGKDWLFRASEIMRLRRGDAEVRPSDVHPGDVVSVFPREWKFDKETKLRAAFLLALDPAARQSDSPTNVARLKARYYFDREGGQGYLPSFETRPLVQILRQAGADAQIENLGVRTWDFKNGAYEVEQVYRISTLEGRYTLIIPVRGSESQRGEYEGRQWRVAVQQVEAREQFLPSELGVLLRGLQNESVKAVESWGKSLENRNLDAIYLQTREPALQTQHVARLCCTSLAAGMTPGGSLIGVPPLTDSQLRRDMFITGYQQFPESSFLVDRDFYSRESEGQREIPPLLKQLLHGEAVKELIQLRVMSSASQPGPIPTISAWRIEGDELIFTHPVELRISVKYRCDAAVEVATKDAALAQRVRALREAGGGTISGARQNPMAAAQTRQTGWRIARFHLLDAASPTISTQQQPGSTPAGPMNPGGVGLMPPGGPAERPSNQ